MSTGYNGPASQQPLCNPCHRKGSPSGVGLLDSCVAIHAEQNALLQCPDVMRIYTAYVTVSPCLTCIKLLMNTGCQRIVFMNYYAHEKAEEMWKSLGREWIHYTADDNVVEVFNRMSEIRKSHKLLILNNNL
jgi:dCMP deaminase